MEEVRVESWGEILECSLCGESNTKGYAITDIGCVCEDCFKHIATDIDMKIIYLYEQDPLFEPYPPTLEETTLEEVVVQDSPVEEESITKEEEEVLSKMIDLNGWVTARDMCVSFSTMSSLGDEGFLINKQISDHGSPEDSYVWQIASL
jgi:hypothetical protein